MCLLVDLLMLKRSPGLMVRDSPSSTSGLLKKTSVGLIAGNSHPAKKKVPFAGLVIVKLKELLLGMCKNSED